MLPCHGEGEAGVALLLLLWHFQLCWMVSTSNERNFSSGYENLDEFICFVIYGDDGCELGHAVAKIEERFEKDSDGAYITVKYLGCSDPYYRWYYQHEGGRGGLPRGCYHHLCRRHHSRCARAISDAKVIHVQKWSPITRPEAQDLCKAWGEPGIPAEPSAPPPSLQTAPKSKVRPATGLASLPAPRTDFGRDDEEEDDEDEPEVSTPPQAYETTRSQGPR